MIGQSVVAFALGMLASVQAWAQTASPSLSAGVASDEKRRGISWSDRRAVARIAVELPVITDVTIDTGFTTLRGSDRHHGASGVIDLRAAYGHWSNQWRTNAEVVGHVFVGAEHLNYVEMGIGGGVLVGPVQFDLYTLYAPPQSSIGGDNLYLGGQASVGIIGTPLSLTTAIGYSGGIDGDSPRLRPGGDYVDYRAQIDITRGAMTMGLAYIGTMSARSADAEDRAVARLTFAF